MYDLWYDLEENDFVPDDEIKRPVKGKEDWTKKLPSAPKNWYEEFKAK